VVLGAKLMIWFVAVVLDLFLWFVLTFFDLMVYLFQGRNRAAPQSDDVHKSKTPN
jgi:hypothetical protein